MFKRSYQNRTNLCRFYFSKKGCKFKSSCLFSHVKPKNWVKQECWYYNHTICIFGRWCFNYHNKNRWFTSQDHKEKKDANQKICSPNNSKIPISGTNQIKVGNVKNHEGTYKKNMCPYKSKKGLKGE